MAWMSALLPVLRKRQATKPAGLPKPVSYTHLGGYKRQIVGALIANQFWKTGVIRGSVPVFTTVALTYLIVRYGLMEFTNFSIGNLGLSLIHI